MFLFSPSSSLPPQYRAVRPEDTLAGLNYVTQLPWKHLGLPLGPPSPRPTASVEGINVLHGLGAFVGLG